MSVHVICKHRIIVITVPLLCLFVCWHTGELCKNGIIDGDVVFLIWKTHVGPRNHVLDGVNIVTPSKYS